MRKLGVVMATMAVLAFCVPAMAGAASVTSKAGTLAPVGTKLTATGNDVIFTSSILGSITCEKVNFNATLTKNDGSTFEASSAAEAPATVGCLLNGKPFTITTVEITKLTASSTVKTMSFKMTIDFAAECTLTGTNVPFTYAAGGDTITFTSAAGISAGPCGTFKLDGAFTIEIGSTPVILD